MAVSMVGGASNTHRVVMQRESTGVWSSTPLADYAVLAHRTDEVRLDKAFPLIEGHPAPGAGRKG